MGVTFKKSIINPQGKHNTRTLELMQEVIGITNHNTANTKPSADSEAHAKWLQNVENADELYISSHFYVDDEKIIQTCPITEVTFHAGDGKGDGNRKTISVEICENGDIAKAELNAQKLNASLIQTYPHLKIYKHQDWSGKFCPRVILARKNGWSDFVVGINKLVESETKPDKLNYRGVNLNDYYQTPIMGKQIATNGYLWGYVVEKGHQNDVPRELPEIYLYEGYVEGVRGDIAFCQAMKETGFWTFGGIAQPEWNNPCGLGVTGKKKTDGTYEHCEFESLQLGVRAHIQHLKAYGSKKDLCQKKVDHRFTLVKRGICPRWIDLNGKWAVPGTTYGQDIMKMYIDMCLSDPQAPPESKPEPDDINYDEEIKRLTSEIQRLQDELKEERTENEVCYNSIKNKEKQVEDLKEDYVKLLSKLDGLTTKSANYLVANENLSQKLDLALNKIDELVKKNGDLMLSKNSYIDELFDVKAMYSDALRQISELKMQIPSKTTGLTLLQIKSITFTEWLSAKFKKVK